MSRRKIRKGSPQSNVPNEGGVCFFGDFRSICRHISKTAHFTHNSTKLLYRTVIGNHMQAIEWCQLRWPWVTSDPGFKDTVVLKGEYLQSDAFCTHSYYRTLIGNHRQAIDRRAIAIQLQPHCSYKPYKRFASVALVCQRQLDFLVELETMTALRAKILYRYPRYGVQISPQIIKVYNPQQLERTLHKDPAEV